MYLYYPKLDKNVTKKDWKGYEWQIHVSTVKKKYWFACILL